MNLQNYLDAKKYITKDKISLGENIKPTQEDIDKAYSDFLNILFLQFKNGIKEELAHKRYLTEVSGITINLLKIKTDRESQVQISNLYNILKNKLVKTINFKTDNTWADVSLEDIKKIMQEVTNHVQKCFTVERKISELIDTLKEEDLLTFNIEDIWNTEFSK